MIVGPGRRGQGVEGVGDGMVIGVGEPHGRRPRVGLLRIETGSVSSEPGENAGSWWLTEACEHVAQYVCN